MYSLHVAQKVKQNRRAGSGAAGAGRTGQAAAGKRAGARTTKVSSKNQITIPAAELRAAGLGPGDVLRVEALGAGRVALTRVDELVGRYAGALDSQGRLRRRLDELREEWP
jgi:AbrB family looped-hinge helix DNA binding protein